MSSSNYDDNAKVYYRSLVNTLILYSMNVADLDRLAGPTFNPLTELETELDFAFTPVIFETVFRNQLIEAEMKDELIAFKADVDTIPNEIWDYPFVDCHPKWIRLHNSADRLLTMMGITTRTYSEYYTVHVIKS